MTSDEYGIDYEAIVKHLGPCPGEDWWIDHIIPVAAFNFDDHDEVRAAFAPENHQWLPKIENIRKSDTVDPERKAALIKAQTTNQIPILWVPEK